MDEAACLGCVFYLPCSRHAPVHIAHSIMYSTHCFPPQTMPSTCKAWLAAQRLPAPIIVGGTGGSGTRLLVQMLRELAVHMGTHVNASEDAMYFVPVYDQCINAYLTGEMHTEDVDCKLMPALQQHCQDIPPHQRWGWKNPRSIYLWPALSELLPHAHFLHVVRDGFAMSNSANQNQLKLHGHVVLDEGTLSLAPADQSLQLWTTVNTAAADFGKQIGARYLRVRYEDAVANPLSTLHQLAEFLQVLPPDSTQLQIQPVRSRTLTAHDFSAQVITHAAPTLKRFGYPAC